MADDNFESKKERKKFNSIQTMMIFLIIMFFVGGTIVLCMGLVRFANFNMAREVQATIVKVDNLIVESESAVDVVYEYEVDGELIQSKKRYRDSKTINSDGSLVYYEGKDVTIRVSKNDASKIVVFSTAEILAIVFGAVFDIVAMVLLYFGFLRKPSVVALIEDYNKAIYEERNVGSDDSRINEARADELNKLSPYSVKHKLGMFGVWKKRLSDNFKTTPLIWHIFCVLYFVALVVWGIIDEVVLHTYKGFGLLLSNIFISLIIGLLVFAIVGMICKLIFNLWLSLTIKTGKFTEEAVGEVLLTSFSSEHIVNFGEFGKNNVLKRTHKVILNIDGKKSVGYVSGLLPPPKGTKLKVLVKPNSFKRFILDIEK